jgi:hypothetical protein
MIRSRSTWIRRAEAVAALVVVGLVVGLLVTRSSTPPSRAGANAAANTGSGSATTASAPSGASSGSATTAGAASGSGATTAPGGTTASGSQSAPTTSAGSKYVQQLQQRASLATHATFKATYRAKGSNTTIVFAQDGSKSSFLTGTTAYYSDGSSNTVCDSSSGTPACYTGAKPLGGLLSLLSPTRVSSAIQAAAAVSVSHTSEHHSGQPSSCIAYSDAGQRVKYCIDVQGIVTYIKIPNGAFELTAYTTAVSPGDVSVPAGATTLATPPAS